MHRQLSSKTNSAPKRGGSLARHWVRHPVAEEDNLWKEANAHVANHVRVSNGPGPARGADGVERTPGDEEVTLRTYRRTASFGKRQEFVVIGELLRHGFDVSQTLGDDFVEPPPLCASLAKLVDTLGVTHGT